MLSFHFSNDQKKATFNYLVHTIIVSNNAILFKNYLAEIVELILISLINLQFFT